MAIPFGCNVIAAVDGPTAAAEYHQKWNVFSRWGRHSLRNKNDLSSNPFVLETVCCVSRYRAGASTSSAVSSANSYRSRLLRPMGDADGTTCLGYVRARFACQILQFGSCDPAAVGWDRTGESAAGSKIQADQLGGRGAPTFDVNWSSQDIRFKPIRPTMKRTRNFYDRAKFLLPIDLKSHVRSY